ncbi:MAG: hypothetical protein JXA54_12280 [Candidatus Heimdallarchaeota archaeon]|nr:hypothetical protein [Candidatus Heimdallarchaeota archaeon]
MKISIKTLEDYGFLLAFFGGIITSSMALLSFIVSVAKANIHWFFGSGFIGIASPVGGSIVSLIFGIFAILIGMKLFSSKINEITKKIDALIISIILVVISIVVFGFGGLIILVGAVLILIYRLKPANQSLK